MVKLCEYGCGKEAKYQFKNGKWCCSNNISKCMKIKIMISESKKGEKNPMYGKVGPRKGIKVSKETRKKQSISKKGKKRLPFSEEHKKKIGDSNKITIKQIKERYPFFSQIEEMRYNPDKPEEKEIQVHCKNHNCLNSKEKGGWFTPVRYQLYGRISSLEKIYGNDGSYFYCSEECKNICPLYFLNGDPFKNIDLPYTQQEQRIWRQTILKLDNYQCQYCGEEATHAHHIKPVKTHPHLCLDPDNGISFCEDCHYKIGHKKGSRCSTGNIAKVVQQGCFLGGFK